MFFFKPKDRLYKAAERHDGQTEANFLKVLKGCGEAEVKYRGGWPACTVLHEMARGYDWPVAAKAVIERGCEAVAHLGRSAAPRTALAAQGAADLVRAALASHAYVSGVQEKAHKGVSYNLKGVIYKGASCKGALYNGVV